MYSKITKYGITGILICLALGSYLKFLADRDAKMFSNRRGLVTEASKVSQ